MKKTIITVLLSGICFLLAAQNDFIATQYIHNRFAINPAFAGSRNGMTVFASHRKQWQGLPSSASSQLFTTHAPLRNDNIALGANLWHQKYQVASNNGFSFTYAYRFRTTQNNWFALAASPGVSFTSAGWDKANTIEPGDEAFATNEKTTSPILGFGASWYGSNFFSGFSIPSLFHTDEFKNESSKFSLSDATYCLTAGYLHSFNESWAIQPAVLVRYNKLMDEVMDFDATLIYRNLLMVGLSYRTTDEASATLAVMIDRRFRIAYSYDHSFGDIGKYHNGSHELSIQYDFVYRTKSVNPKFF
jgi:type IX secretion system PorP/SprF family membrane protein